jgi:hypothetical protein
MSKRVANSKSKTKARNFRGRRRFIEKRWHRAQRRQAQEERDKVAPTPKVTAKPWHQRASAAIKRMFRRKV